MSILARAVGATIIVVVLVAVLSAAARGSRSEYDAIEAPLTTYMDAWAAAGGDIEFPDSASAEEELVALWDALPYGTACNRFAGLALGIVVSAGDYAETGQTAYLFSGSVLFDLLDEAGYACLISI